IKKQPYIYYVRLTFKNRHFFRYLTCLLDRGHIKTKEILEKLPNYFIQIHASYILNPKYIKDFDSKTVTILLNGAEEHLLPISRKFQFSFKEKYYRYLSERHF
ncbi:MAG: LytTR family DNA-binding domain-containing protein, partial [Streptococcus salivarius]|nr:LytTR family DNA-binding domain-containing protein [Streptococcus salivarius]